MVGASPASPGADLTGAGGGRAAADQYGTALWSRPKIGTEAGRLHAGLQQVANQYDEPALTLHFRAEGRYYYAVLVFAPSPPFDLFDPDRKGRVKLYVRRVFITDDADVLPRLSALCSWRGGFGAICRSMCHAR